MTTEIPSEACAGCTKGAVIPTFQDWSQIDCSICSDPIRQICTESPLDLNEHMNLNIIVLPCKHYYHYACIFEWFKHEEVCPYCRKVSDIKTLDKMIYPPVRCRASILRINKTKKSRASPDKCTHEAEPSKAHKTEKPTETPQTPSKPNRLGEQCECLEYPDNMGFCRKHLPPLNELISKSEDSLSLDGVANHIIDLGNRKFLTILKYQHLSAFPPDIKKELLIKAHSLIKNHAGKYKTHAQLLSEIAPHMTTQ